MSLFVSIVLDGVGIGAQPDAEAYGDVGSHTLGHVLRDAQPALPNLARLGLGCIEALPGLQCPSVPRADYGRMQEVSAGKDSTTGHWELAGLRLPEPFPTYPDGFPNSVINAFIEETGCPGVLGNKPESGTVIIEELGEEHERTGKPIVYTSADSVFQIAAHKDVVPLETLYEWCEIAREAVCTGPHGVGRVIARPFVGAPGDYTRISAERRDYARLPEEPPLQDVLQQHGVRTVAVGKIADLFGRTGFDAMIKTKTNADGVDETRAQIEAYREDPEPTFVWTNLVDFDQEYGHRNNVAGFGEALEAFDAALPGLVQALPAEARLILTADHGNDPTTGSTDHAREFVPLLSYSADSARSGGRDLGLRPSFNDHALTIADFFDVPLASAEGASFLRGI